ncbi:hypothetical protein [Maricaulis sp. CAU 1757]
MTVQTRPQLHLDSRAARRLWARFLNHLDHNHADLDATQRDELRDDATAHIADAMARDAEGSEAERLQRAIDQFGVPPAPAPAWQAQAGTLLHYGSLPVLGLGGLLVALLVIAALWDLVPPHHAGLWVYPDGAFSLSFEAQDGAVDVLGPWFTPLALIAAAGLAGALESLRRLAVSADGPARRWMNRTPPPAAN